jgi:shikimate kinase
MTLPIPHNESPPTWVAMAGFMGTGKSRIGWELSRRLNLTFVDTDRIIEQVSCMPITKIFEIHGEVVFRDYETEVLRRCLRLDEVVVSTGGGTVTRKVNRELLSSRGPVVVLSAKPETIFRRTRQRKRPLLNTTDPLEKIRSLLTQRQEAYDAVATITVSTEGRDSKIVVDEIIGYLLSQSPHP